MNYADLNAITETVVRAKAPGISARFRGAVSGSGLQRRTGKSVRGFASKINRDRSTGEIWGVSFGTQRSVYMHHHGMEPQTVSRGGNSYDSKGYTKRGMLTTPAEEGAKELADALVVAQANYVVTGIRF